MVRMAVAHEDACTPRWLNATTDSRLGWMGGLGDFDFLGSVSDLDGNMTIWAAMPAAQMSERPPLLELESLLRARRLDVRLLEGVERAGPTGQPDGVVESGPAMDEQRVDASGGIPLQGSAGDAGAEAQVGAALVEPQCAGAASTG